MAERVRTSRLSIEVDSALLKRLSLGASERKITVREYVLSAVECELGSESDDDWSRVSEASFARDWESDADAVYDHM